MILPFCFCPVHTFPKTIAKWYSEKFPVGIFENRIYYNGYYEKEKQSDASDIERYLGSHKNEAKINETFSIFLSYILQVL